LTGFLTAGKPEDKARLQSLISAASVQETTNVLAEAALAGMVDMLVGLK
jgi:hypothetical protein